MTNAVTRTCYRCGVEKPISAFEADKRKPLGKAYRCLECKRVDNKKLYRKKARRLAFIRTNKFDKHRTFTRPRTTLRGFMEHNTVEGESLDPNEINQLPDYREVDGLHVYPNAKGVRPLGAINEQQRKMILAAIKDSLPFQSACEAVGVSYYAFMDWRKQGNAVDQRIAEGDNTLTENELVYLTFYRDVLQAKAVAAKGLVGAMVQASEWDWRAADALLGRVHHERYTPPKEDAPVNNNYLLIGGGNVNEFLNQVFAGVERNKLPAGTNETPQDDESNEVIDGDWCEDSHSE